MKFKYTKGLSLCALLPLSLLTLFNCSPAEKKVETATAPPVFKRVLSSRSGVEFKNVVDENINNYFDFFAYVYNGGGVGIGDINNDGLSDIYFTGNEVSNKLYLNQGIISVDCVQNSFHALFTNRVI